MPTSDPGARATPPNSPREFPVGIRPCRGHWHVTTLNEDGSEGEYDLSVLGDPFKTAEEAQAMANRMNRGEEIGLSGARATPGDGAPRITDKMVEAAAKELDVTWGYLDPLGDEARRQARRALEAAFRAALDDDQGETT